MQVETRYDNARRYYLRIPETSLEGQTLPDILINCYRKKGFIECQTLNLVKLNQRIEDSHQEVVLMSDKTVAQLIDNVRAEIQPLFRVSDSIAMLDMLAAFAQLVTTSDYVKPDITRCLAIKSGRHPVYEKVQKACWRIGTMTDRILGAFREVYSQRCVCGQATAIPDNHRMQHEREEHVHSFHCSNDSNGPDRKLCSSAVCIVSDC